MPVYRISMVRPMVFSADVEVEAEVMPSKSDAENLPAEQP